MKRFVDSNTFDYNFTVDGFKTEEELDTELTTDTKIVTGHDGKNRTVHVYNYDVMGVYFVGASEG